MTEHEKHNRPSPLRRLLNAFGIGKEHGRESARSEQRSRDNRRSEAGNVFFTLFGAVAIVGVLGAGIMSTMRGPLTTMVEVNRIEEAKSVIRLNSRLVLQNATRGDSALATTPPASAYCDDDDYTEAPAPVTCSGPTGGGCLPASVGATLTDPWGTPYGYCSWNHGTGTGTGANTCANTRDGTDATTYVTIAIISAGPDRTFDTTCADHPTYVGDAVGDDIITKVPYNDAAAMAGGGTAGGLWSDMGTSAQIGKTLDVTSAGVSQFTGGAQFGDSVSLTGTSIVDTPGVITDEVAAKTGGTLTLSADTTVDGTLTTTSGHAVTLNGATEITDSLTVSGANPTALGGTLNVTGATTVTTLNATGAVDFDSTLNVDGATTVTTLNATGATDLDSTLNVDGATTMNSTMTINAAGNVAGTDVIVVNNSTPSEIMSLDEAGNLEIAGAFTFKDGLNINGLADAGKMLIADATGKFTPVDMSGDVTISNTGVTTIQNDAVTTAKILDGAVTTPKIADDAITNAKIAIDAVDTDELVNGAVTTAKINAGGTEDQCLRISGTSVAWEDCTAGGTGDGVGAAVLWQLLANGNSAYNTSTSTSLKIIDLADPDDPQDAATKNYVDTALGDISSSRIIDAPEAPALVGDTYIDVDTADPDDGLTNTTVFFNDGVESMRILATGQVNMASHATIAGNLAVDTSVLFVDSATNDNVGIGTASPLASAILDITSTTKGVLPPRMTVAQRDTMDNAYGAPETGMTIFTTDAGDAGLLQFWDGTQWVDVGGGGAETGGLWAADDAGGNFIEYDDTLGGMRVGRITGQPAPAIDWTLDVANSLIYTNHAVGIGVSAISDDTGANTDVVLDLVGDIAALEYCDTDGANCFNAGDIATLVGGGGAPTNRIEDGGDGNTFVDTDTAGNDTTNSIVFNTAGTERMIITATGNVGIGTSDPKAPLHVNGEAIIGASSPQLACDADREGAMRYRTGVGVEYCDGTSWKTVAASGTGIQLQISPQTKNDMDVDGTGGAPATGATVTFTITNTGDQTSDPLSYSLTGDTANFNVLADTCNTTTLAQNATCQIDIQPETSGNGIFRATLAIPHHNAPSAALEGEGINFTCSAGMQAFGGVVVQCDYAGAGNHLIMMPSGCDGTMTNPTCSGADTHTLAWATSPFNGVDLGTVPTSSGTDGAQNTVNMLTYSPTPATSFPAANYCNQMSHNGQGDWFLPAANQMILACNQGVGSLNSSSYYTTSTPQSTTKQDRVATSSCGIASGSSGWKSDTNPIRCMRIEGVAIPAAQSDTTPDPISFASGFAASAGVTVTSTTETIAGITTGTSISISGATAEYSVNGGAFTATAGTVNWGDTVAVRMDSGAAGTGVQADLTIGSSTFPYSVITVGDCGGAGCTGVDKRVFVTSVSDMRVHDSASVIDSKCQTAADNAGLGGTWMGIYSNSSSPAASRLDYNWDRLVNMNGDLIANSPEDLWDGSITNSISYDENGAFKIIGVVTNTNEFGSYRDDARGESDKAGSQWILRGTDFTNDYRSAYCLEATIGSITLTSTPSSGASMNVIGPGSPATGSEVTFTIQNTGTAPTAALGTSLSNSTNFQITTDTCAGNTLAAAATCTVGVTPQATADGNYFGTLTVLDGTNNVSIAVGMSGVASGFGDAVAQWLKGLGLNDIHYSLGNVGIGTNDPKTSLDLTGTIRIGNGSELCNSADHEGGMIYIAADDKFQVCANSADGWKDLSFDGSGTGGLWTDLGGNRVHYGIDGDDVQVGIGTNNPVTTLDVNGGVRVGSVSAPAPTYLALNSLSNVATTPADGECLVYNNTSGNWVNGDCNAGGGDNLGNGTGLTGNIVLGSYYLSGDGDDEGITINADGQVFLPHNTFVQAANTTGSVSMNIVNTALTVDSNARLSFRGSGSGNSSTYAAGITQGWDAASTDNANLEFTVRSAGAYITPMRIASSGNVGIGTDNPQATLDVNGGLRLAGVSGAEPTASGGLWTDDGSGNINNTDNGNVGIGDFSSDTIDSALHLQSGEIRLDGGAANQAGCIQYNDTADQLEYSDDCTTFSAFGGGGLWTSDDAGANIYNADNGNVGVGTAFPQANFDVSDLQLDVGTGLCPAGYTEGDYDGEADAADCRRIGLTVNKTTGQVGIGTTAPTTEAALHIVNPNAASAWNYDTGLVINTEAGGSSWGTALKVNGDQLVVGNTWGTPEVSIGGAGNDTPLTVAGRTGTGIANILSILPTNSNNTPPVGQGARMLFRASDNNYSRRSYAGIAGIVIDPDNTALQGALTFYSTNSGTLTEVGRFDAQGDFGIGVADPQVKLDVAGDIQYTGTLTDVSDRRLKTDITPLSAEDMIARLAAVDTYTFRMIDDEKGTIEYGVMAQELEEIFPELVRTADDEMGTKSVNYTGLIAPMIEATKALKTENDALKAQLNAVQEQQAVVLARLETMQSDVNGMKVHTGYGIEKGTALAMLLLLLSLGGITATLVVQRQKPTSSKDRT